MPCRSWSATAGSGRSAARFDGAEAPGCAALGGPTRDLNLMLHGDARGAWSAPSLAWRSAPSPGARATAGPARWQGGADQQTITLPAHTLLHGSARGPAAADRRGPEPMLWIAVDPGDD